MLCRLTEHAAATEVLAEEMVLFEEPLLRLQQVEGSKEKGGLPP